MIPDNLLLQLQAATSPFTLQQLSDLTGYDKSNLSKILRGKANPSLDTLLNILSHTDYHLTIIHN